MNIKFESCNFADLKEELEIYKKNLSSPIESYLEEHILKSKHYVIKDHEERIGYFSIYDKKLLTQFYIDIKYRYLSQEVLFKIKKMEKVGYAYAPTCDQYFLSHALDSYKSVDKQAYFFKDSKRKIEKVAYNEGFELTLAKEEDIEDILNNSGKFFDKIEENIQDEKIFIVKKDSITVGYGVMEKGIIMKGYVSIGMFVIEKYRQQGMGRSIILNLKRKAYENSMIPIAGCGYYNHNSKKTLESAGMYSDTRLLKISF